MDDRWFVQHVRIREGRRVRHQYQLLDLHTPLPGTSGLMHVSLGPFATEAQARAAIPAGEPNDG